MCLYWFRLAVEGNAYLIEELKQNKTLTIAYICFCLDFKYNSTVQNVLLIVLGNECCGQFICAKFCLYDQSTICPFID